MPKFSAEELAQAHAVLNRVAAQLYGQKARVPDYVWTLPGDGYWGWAFSRADTGPFTSLARLTAAAEEVTRRYATQIERDARKKVRASSRKNPSPERVVNWLDFDEESGGAAILRRDEYVEGETFPIWTVTKTEPGDRTTGTYRVYRHDDPYYGETVATLRGGLLAANAVERDAVKWLADEPYRIMLRKHGLRP